MRFNSYIFAENDPTKISSFVLERYNRITNFMLNRGFKARWEKSFSSYYGMYYTDPKATYGIGTAGSQGELTAFAINQYRNLLQHTLSLFTQTKIVFDTIPINSDTDGRNAAIVANTILEYMVEQPQFAQELYMLAEQGLLFGTSFLKIFWDTDKNFKGINGDLQPVFTGKVALRSYNPLDVILEPFKEKFDDQDWVTTREIVNRFDLINKYPEKEKEILALPKISDTQRVDPYFVDDQNHVFLYNTYHKSTMALPFGRYTIFGSDELVFEDYRESPYCFYDQNTNLPIIGTGIPLVCFRPSITYGSAFGHTVGFDLLPCQDMKNLLASTVASNIASFGVQNIIVPRGSNFPFADIANGVRVLEFDPNPDLGPGAGAPATLELLKTPTEIFNYNNKIDEEMEKLSAINGALRGTPPPQISSGTAMALLTTQAQTFNSQVEKAYITCIQEAASQLLKLMAKFMPDTDLVKMVGVKENFAISSFRSAELSRIYQVKVLMGNPISKSTAGRLAMAQDMLNSGQVTPTEYIEVAQTGSLKNNVEDITAEDALIQWENQQIIEGKPVEVLITDNHLKHILKHKAMSMQPDVRNDPQKLAILTDHMAKHQLMWTQLGTNNPQLLALITGSPIPPDVPAPGVVAPANGPEQLLKNPQPHTNHAPQAINKIDHPGGMGKNNIVNASTPGGNVDLAQSAIRSATKLISKVR